MLKIALLGSGIIGSSTLITLFENGYSDITLITKKFLDVNSPSYNAAAFWYPFLCNPVEKVSEWAKYSYLYYQKHEVNHSNSGCKNIPLKEFLGSKTTLPRWNNFIDVKVGDISGLLNKSYSNFHTFNSIGIHAEIYLNYLHEKIINYKIPIIEKEIRKVNELKEFDVIINCIGLGASELFLDKDLVPRKGQMIILEKFNLNEIIVDLTGVNSLIEIVPRENHIKIVGTAEQGVSNLETYSATINDIIKRATNIVPEVGSVRILNTSACLRPVRKEIRLESEIINGLHIIHNYGHGGGGYTTCWGCAKEVLTKIKKVESD